MQSRQLLLKLLEMAGGATGSGLLLALDGEGLEDVPDSIVAGAATYQVCRPVSELGLRRCLSRVGGAPLIALVPEELALRLPPDLLRRARGQRVYALDVHEVLQVALNAQVIGTDDDELRRLALANVERLRALIRERTLPTVIDRQLLEELLLDACVGQRVRTTAAADLLVDWLRESPRWEPAVRALVVRNLPTLHGAEGRVLAWALRQGIRLAAVVVRGSLLDIDAELPRSAWGEIEPALGDREVGLTEEVLRGTVARLAKATLDGLGPAAGAYLEEAETIGRQILTATTLGKSKLLPLGLDSRCHQAAQRAASGQPVSHADIEWMKRHRAAPLRAKDLAVLEEIARLSRWLAEPAAEVGGVPERVKVFQESSAFGDMSAARLRRALAASGSFQVEAETMLERWRARRDAENRHFAEALAAGYTRGLHSLAPLHRLWSEVALRVDGPLFLVVMDGLSYPTFLELVGDLSQMPGSPIGIENRGGGRAAGLAVLAPLPTVTSHARGALFLGQVPSDPWVAETAWRDTAERSTDPGRFRQNQALGGRSRQLFLKGDLADGGRALKTALMDSSIEVVAAVFNAVDDQIGSTNTGAMLRVRPDEIAGLLPALDAAFAARRNVLLAADHGHTPFLGTGRRLGAGSCARYRELAGGEATPPGLIEIDLEGLGGTRSRMAFAWQIGTYLGGPQVGFHGGCGLEEMVVPVAWLARGGVAADVPGWWYGGADAAAGDEPAAERARPVRPARPARPGAAGHQQALFDVRPRVTAGAAAFAGLGLACAPDALDDGEKAALVLLAQVGSARQVELAAAIGRKANRIAGFMSKLQQKLGRLGLRCLRTEVLPTGEEQYHWERP